MLCELENGQIKDLHYSVGAALVKEGKAKLVTEKPKHIEPVEKSIDKIEPVEPKKRGRKPKEQ